MRLFETPGNPIPPNLIVAPIRTQDGLTLRTARWSSRQPGGAPPRGTVAIAIGRSEFIEEYYEIVGKLLARGFDVAVFDWRGQGQSDREIAAARRGHVSDFRHYRRDLDAFERQILQPFATKPWFGLGHSMGAAILLDQAHDGTSPFERLVLSAPMIAVPLRAKKWIRRLARVVDGLGFGTRLIPGGSEISLFNRPFADNILTTDPRQYARLAAATLGMPELAVGAPTIRWLRGALDLMQRFEHPLFPVEILTPVLIIAAGADRIVDTAATERFAIRLKAGGSLTIPGARHQVIMERESITDQVWAAFDAFIPGYEAAMAKWA